MFLLASTLMYFSASVQAETTQDTDMVSNGIVTHGSDSRVHIGWAAQLRNASSSVLETQTLSVNTYSQVLSCEHQQCSASGSAFVGWDIKDFTSAASDTYLYVPYLTSKNFTSSAIGQSAKVLLIDAHANVSFENDLVETRIEFLEIGYDSELTLSSGIYWVENLTLRSQARIRSKGDGPVWIMAKNFTWIGYRASISSSSSASPVGLVSYSDITFNSEAKVQGVVYAKGRAYLGWRARIEGALLANEIDLLPEARVTYIPENYQQLDLSQILRPYFADMDNDGIPDEKDPDRDGDGIDNSLEEQAGTDPSDPDSVPMDKNNNGIPDILETRIAEPNQCTAPFINALQAAASPGEVTFGLRSFLKNTSSSQLNMLAVYDDEAGTKPTCREYACEASGVLVNANPRPVFKTSDSAVDHYTAIDDQSTIQAGSYRDIEVDAFATLRFNKGQFHGKRLLVNYGATVELEPGDYWFEEIWFDPESRLLVKGNGTVRLHVKESLTTHWRAVLNPKGGPRKLLISSYGAIHIGNEGSVKALVVTDSLTLNERARIKGSVLSSETDLNPYSRIIFKEKAILRTDFGAWCDIDRDSIYDGFDKDRDGDGVDNTQEIEWGTDPDDPLSVPVDSDGDGIPDPIDDDRDGDGYANENDAFPDNANEWEDLDGDGIGNNSDPDIDGDGINNDYETQLGHDPLDPADAPADLDSDGLPDQLDNDIDNDGIENDQDAFPTDPNEWSDIDGDGTGDNADTDRDGDGISNDQEQQLGFDPNDPANTPPDADGDGLADALDSDIDNDGHPNEQDAFPYDPNEWKDLDGDGIGDNSDADRDGDGFDNDFEIERGNNPDDANDYPDVVKPEINLNSLPQEVVESRVLISGAISDDHSGIAQAYLQQQTLDNVQLDIALDDQGQFSVWVPLKLGTNQLTVIAVDDEANQQTSNIVIEFRSPPELINLTPANGSLVPDSSIEISGQLKTWFAPTDVRIQLNGVQLALEPLDSADLPAGQHIYQFESFAVDLETGENRLLLEAQTPDGTHAMPLTYRYIPGNIDEIPLPEITLLAPTEGAYLNGDSFAYGILAVSHAGNVQVRIDGQPVSTELEQPVQQVNGTKTLVADQSQTNLLVSAMDGAGRVTNKTFTFKQDTQAPVVEFYAPYHLADHEITDTDVTLKGKVSDLHLASLLINDQAVLLKPGASVGEYEFIYQTRLLPGETKTYVAHARDIAGNRQAAQVTLNNTASMSLDWIAPANRAQYFAADEAFQVAVIPSQALNMENLRVRIIAADNSFSAYDLALTGNWYTAEVPVPAQGGDYQLVAELLSEGQVVLSSIRHITVIDPQLQTLVLVSAQPENLATDVAVDAPLQLTFNKVIADEATEIRLYQSVIGKSYRNQDAPQTPFFAQKGDVLVNVQYEREPVAVRQALLPGNQTLMVYPADRLAFGAWIDIEVEVAGNLVQRLRYKTESPPTLVQGRVKDVFGQSIPGIKVQVEGSELFTVTDENGEYGFGFENSQTLQAGAYALQINPQLANERYGNKTLSIDVREGRLNRLDDISLVPLDITKPRDALLSGTNSLLAGGDIELDLSKANIEMPAGYNSAIHVTYLPATALPDRHPALMPYFIYALTPSGSRVQGDAQLDIRVPKYLNSYDYLNQYEPGTLVVLLGFNSAGQVLEVSGVGRMNNGRINSLATTHYQTLDYLGFSFVQPEQQILLQQYVDGEIDIHRLRQEIEQ